MKAQLECIPCILQQTVTSVRKLENDVELQRIILDKIMHFLQQTALDRSPPELGKYIYKMIKNISQNDDPFKEIKKRDNQILMAKYPHLKSIIYRDSNPIRAAAKLAIAGNIIDYGANGDFENIEQFSDDVNQMNLSVNHLNNLLKDLNNVDHILYLADNAGELVLDKLFIEILKRFYMTNDLNITVVVRGNPVINDATKDDAKYIGMDEVAYVIDNGDDTPGTLLKYCSSEMNDHFNRADLIISKGQGNYETLDLEKKLIYFMFIVKCPIIAQAVGANMGDLILKCNK